MCGISGHVGFNAPPEVEGVVNLVKKIRHRGPDDTGIWQSPERPCTLGHACLSVIDLSSLGHQPMVDEKTGNAIVFNGEIYNF